MVSNYWRGDMIIVPYADDFIVGFEIRRAELVDSETSMTAANDLAIRRALELAGVEFIDENGGGPGVRLRNVSGQSPLSDRWRAEQSVWRQRVLDRQGALRPID